MGEVEVLSHRDEVAEAPKIRIHGGILPRLIGFPYQIRGVGLFFFLLAPA